MKPGRGAAGETEGQARDSVLPTRFTPGPANPYFLSGGRSCHLTLGEKAQLPPQQLRKPCSRGPLEACLSGHKELQGEDPGQLTARFGSRSAVCGRG